jgi:putative ATP-dependent endonuclease of OLD family
VFLHALRIDNFRGIRKATINFDDGTALIGENDCGISSVLDALELALGREEEPDTYPAWLFHRTTGSGSPAGPIRLQLRFREARQGEWSDAEYAPLAAVLPKPADQSRELWYEIVIRPGRGGKTRAELCLRSPADKNKSCDPDLVRLVRQLNPVIRVSAGMLTGHGRPAAVEESTATAATLLTPKLSSLVERINKAVDSRLSRRSLDLESDLEDGISAALSLMEIGKSKLADRESGLIRSVSEIVGWSPSGAGHVIASGLNGPNSAPERLGILLMIGALLRARPMGIRPGADPLWLIEEPEAHLHPITLTSMALFVRRIQRQRIVTTYSGELLSMLPLDHVRRLVRHDGVVYERRVHANTLTRSEKRRFHYHLRSRFGITSFARLWLLVEGESEYWLIPQIARLMGYEFALEGIACVEFAQCGLDPPIKVARELGIEWHLLADGDPAGQNYVKSASQYLLNGNSGERLTVLQEKDIERCFWQHGYDRVYKRHAHLPDEEIEQLSPGKVIQAAVRRRSKPFLALSIAEAIAKEDSAGIPELLQKMIHTCVDLARQSPTRLAGS